MLQACTGTIGEEDQAGAPGSGAPAAGAGAGPSASPGDPRYASYRPGASHLRRLTGSQFRASVRDLLGAVDLPEVEEIKARQFGLLQVGASVDTLSSKGVEQYEAAAREGVRQVFLSRMRRDALVGCTPKAPPRDDACARAFLGRFGRLAWRGAPGAADLDRYVKAAGDLAVAENDFYAGLESAASAILQSPRFIYRFELGQPVPDKPGWWRHGSPEMATRLAYFLWNTTPDETLLRAGEHDELVDPVKLRAHVLRMLDAGRGKDGVAGFADDLFELGDLETVPKDRQLFKQLTPSLLRAMGTEVRTLFGTLALGGGDVLEVYDTARTFVNKELATKIYGLAVASDMFVAATYPASTGRAGILGTAAVLTLQSKASATSPTLRGKFIRERLLCQKIPDPPANVPPLPAPAAGASRRQQLDAHRTDKNCAVCHALMDPLGYALESFDALGIYRATDQGVPIDPSGDLDGAAFANARELGRRLRESAVTRACLVKTLYRYATGRADLSSETALVEDLDGRFGAAKNSLRQLVLEIVLSDGFRFASAPGGS